MRGIEPHPLGIALHDLCGPIVRGASAPPRPALLTERKIGPEIIPAAAALPVSVALTLLPINNQQPVSLEGTQTCLQGSKHRHRDIGGETFLKRACNHIALVDHTLRALGDEPISLG